MRSPWFDPRSPDVELRHVLQEKNNNINLKKKTRSVYKKAQQSLAVQFK